MLFPRSLEARSDVSSAMTGTRPVYFDGTGWLDTQIFRREALAFGMVVHGPAVIEEETSATLIPPGLEAHVAVDHGLIVDLKAK